MKVRYAQPTDLTIGHPLRVLLLYAVPMLISMFFQQAYNLVDSWIAGNQIGAEALGAVGTCYPITVLFVAIASGLSLGTSLTCSRHYGAKDNVSVKQAITSSMIGFLPLSLVLSAAGLLLRPFILRMLSVPAEAVAATDSYLRVYILSLPFVFLYNLSNGILNGLGDSRTPLFLLIVSSVCNIILDLVFVVVIPMGVAGLAFATLLSQAFAGILTFMAVMRMYRSFSMPASVWSPIVVKEILAFGVPSMIQHLFTSFGQLSIQNVINGYGLITMAGYSVSFRINGIYVNSLIAISNALSGFIAQNRGAKKPERISSGIRLSLAIVYIFTAFSVLLLQLAGPDILGFFVGSSAGREEIVLAGMGFIRIVTPFYFLVCAKIVFDGALRGIGEMNAFLAVAVADVVIRLTCGRLFSDLWGINGVWSLWPTAWIVGSTMSAGLYRILSHRKRETI